MIKLNDTVKILMTVFGALGVGYGFYIYFNAINLVEITDGITIPMELSIAVIVIWLGAILTLNQEKISMPKEIKEIVNPIKSWGALFMGTPKWVVTLAIMCFIFGLVNFGIMMTNIGLTGVIEGKYVIHNHGQIIKELTEKEFLIEKSKELKGITAMHILFLGMGTGILYPRKGFEQAATNA